MVGTECAHEIITYLSLFFKLQFAFLLLLLKLFFHGLQSFCHLLLQVDSCMKQQCIKVEGLSPIRTNVKIYLTYSILVWHCDGNN